ncbi:unnamed protein product [marine sediment metagenome]|uniref:Uncharacterized protein n=1 Tax=marine sediment metagenome TaxID=412755 RepID=X0Z3V1_9ZZZZ
MSYLGWGGLAEDYGNNVEAEGSVLDIVGGEKVAGGPGQSCFLWGCDDGLGGCEAFVGPGFYLDKNHRAVGVDHNKVDFTGFAGEVAGEFFEAFSFEEFFAAFFSPSAEEFSVSQ